MTLIYLVKCYKILVRHNRNLQSISSATSQINLNWLTHFLFILLLTVIIWINDALFEMPYLTAATSYLYTVSIFFLAYFSIRQKTVFAFKEKDMKEISNILEGSEQNNEIKQSSRITEEEEFAGIEPKAIGVLPKDKPKAKRLSEERLANLSAQLSSLMEKDKLYLDNELNLATVAERLGIGIHEASYLINETTNDNFYNFINKYRVEEARKLLSSAKMEELNILGIAFAAGFNSKTTFNTTFKKITGVSPTQYLLDQKK